MDSGDRLRRPRVQALSNPLREAFVRCLAVVVPVLITVVVLAIVVQSLYRSLDLTVEGGDRIRRRRDSRTGRDRRVEREVDDGRFGRTNRTLRQQAG